MLRSPRVLVLSIDEAETALLQDLLMEHAILTPAKTVAELDRLLKSNSYDALFCGWSFQQGDWKEAVLDIQEGYPGLPLIVLSSGPENREWAEALEAGALDLLIAHDEKQSVLAALEQICATQDALAWWYCDPVLYAGA